MPIDEVDLAVCLPCAVARNAKAQATRLVDGTLEVGMAAAALLGQQQLFLFQQLFSHSRI